MRHNDELARFFRQPKGERHKHGTARSTDNRDVQQLRHATDQTAIAVVRAEERKVDRDRADIVGRVAEMTVQVDHQSRASILGLVARRETAVNRVKNLKLKRGLVVTTAVEQPKKLAQDVPRSEAEPVVSDDLQDATSIDPATDDQRRRQLQGKLWCE